MRNQYLDQFMNNKTRKGQPSYNLCFFETGFLNCFCIRLLYTSLQGELVMSREFESRKEKASSVFVHNRPMIN